MTDATATPAQQIADGYATSGAALELGSVMVGGAADPSAQIRIPLTMMNRHGLVAGATGTGKTKTLQVIAEQLSAAGVPVVMADFKGDLSGLSRPGEAGDKITERASDTGDQWSPTPFPVEFLSLGTGGPGVPVRATISAFGPILLSKVLGLNQNQESTLGLIFHYADQQGLPLLDLKDLRQVITFLTTTAEGKAQLKTLGAVSPQTAGVILRALVNLEADGGDTFFGEPEVDQADLLRVDEQGRGIITLFEVGDQAARPVMFSTFLMWVLADLFSYLPEVGDVDKPKLVFFFDEAHLLFKDASKAFLGQVEQTVKLIRSKGVGVFFCTQLPTDVPKAVLSQLGSRVQHALRAFTPDDQQALAKTVRTYPKTDVYDLATDLTARGIGEAIVTVLSERGAPTPVAWTKLRSPRSLMDTIGPDYIKAAAQASPLFLKYGPSVDRESAYEMLAAKMAPPPAVRPAEAEPMDLPPILPTGLDLPPMPAPVEKAEPSVLETMMDNPAFKSAMRSAGTVIGREITRSIFGTGRRRRR
jgi:DNA helicase HerA-like ATPase